MALAVNPLLTSPVSPAPPGATPAPPPAGGDVGAANQETPQPAGTARDVPTDYQQAIDDETNNKRKHDYRRVRHHHIAHTTINWPADRAVRQRDELPKILDKVMTLARNPDVDRKDVSAMLAGEIGDGHITADQAVSLLNTLPANNERGELHDWLLVHYRAMLGMQTHLHAAFPTRLYHKGSAHQVQQGAPPAHMIAKANEEGGDKLAGEDVTPEGAEATPGAPAEPQ